MKLNVLIPYAASSRFSLSCYLAKKECVCTRRGAFIYLLESLLKPEVRMAQITFVIQTILNIIQSLKIQKAQRIL